MWCVSVHMMGVCLNESVNVGNITTEPLALWFQGLLLLL